MSPKSRCRIRFVCPCARAALATLLTLAAPAVSLAQQNSAQVEVAAIPTVTSPQPVHVPVTLRGFGAADPDSAAQINVGNAYLSRGELEAAERMYEQATECDLRNNAEPETADYGIARL